MPTDSFVSLKSYVSDSNHKDHHLVAIHKAVETEENQLQNGEKTELQMHKDKWAENRRKWNK